MIQERFQFRSAVVRQPIIPIGTMQQTLWGTGERDLTKVDPSMRNQSSTCSRNWGAGAEPSYSIDIGPQYCSKEQIQRSVPYRGVMVIGVPTHRAV